MAKAKSQKKKLVQINSNQQALLRKLPGVDHLLTLAAEDVFFKNIPPVVVVNSIRSVIDNNRQAILNEDSSINDNSLSDPHLIDAVKDAVQKAMTPNLRSTINATGVVVHTNLGRSLLAAEVVENLITIASRYSNLEYNLNIGKRGSRYSSVEDLICEISGAEAAMVVNNNAGAVLLCLETLARDKEVVVSRGELVEIGGSFRVPDVMAKSGGILREVGTTNRTHLRDYENAITPSTGLLLKVHTSNYSVVGFTAEVSLPELVDLGAAHQLPVMEDLGSGTFIDFSKYGLLKEPTVQESVTAGADVITFSGDKLLGGPQSGIIVGKKGVIDRIKKNPITRALRIDKLTLAALESTLRLYRDEDKAARIIPTLRMIMNILYPDSGVVKIFDEQLRQSCTDRIGYMPEERGLYKRMKVRELLKFYGELKGGKKVNQEVDLWLEKLGLSDWANKKVETLSKGMGQKVQFIATVVAKPELVILDEPFTGLDPVNAEAIKDSVLELQSQGTTIIFSTHDMNVAEKMCDFIFMIFKGRKVLDGTLESIQDNYGSDTIRIQTDDGKAVLNDLDCIERINDFGQLQELRMAPDCDPQQVLAAVMSRTRVRSFEIARPSLNDIFLSIAGPEAKEVNHAQGT